MAWLFWEIVGLLPWLAFFAWAWAVRGLSPERLIWPDLPRLAHADEADDRLLKPRMTANRRFYGPWLVLGAIGSAIAISELGPIGIVFLTCAMTPPLLSAIATLRAWLEVRRLR